VNLDAGTAAIMAAIVVTSSGLTFIGTALSPRYTANGARLWGLAYLMVLVAVFSNLVGQASGGAGSIWAHALGHGAGVAAVGCLLLGFRAYNGNEVQGPALMVAALAFLTVAASVIENVGATEGTAEAFTYLALASVSAGAALHAVVGFTRRFVMAWVFAACLILQTIFSFARVLVLVLLGPDDVYAIWMETVGGSIALVSVGLVSTIAVFVLRSVLAGESGMRSTPALGEEVLSAEAFGNALRGVLHRASARTELVVVIAVLVEDVGAITASFGRDVADAATRILRSAVRAYSSPVAIVGEGADANIVLVATTATSPADARRQAGLLYRGVVQRYVGEPGIVVPGVGVGVALSQTLGYAAETLDEGATIAAVQASESDETSVVFATTHSLPVDPFPSDRA
jgi:hypothetical protein